VGHSPPPTARAGRQRLEANNDHDQNHREQISCHFAAGALGNGCGTFIRHGRTRHRSNPAQTVRDKVGHGAYADNQQWRLPFPKHPSHPPLIRCIQAMWVNLIFGGTAALFLAMTIAALWHLRWVRRLPSLETLSAADRPLAAAEGADSRGAAVDRHHRHCRQQAARQDRQRPPETGRTDPHYGQASDAVA
jgi:hypothetical protein